MMFEGCCMAFLLLMQIVISNALRYDPDQVGYNLNENESAVDPKDYWGEWANHTYHSSPANWRFPFYALSIDRYVDGDPSNNEANGTVFEHDWMSNQFRSGGDVRGLQNDLDYIQGMGIKGLYLTGSPFINMPWGSDGYGPLDFTLLDRHHGDIDDWRNLISEIHRRDMYVILDNTMATMGDLLAFQGYENVTVPFNWQEYSSVYKSDRIYHDFQPGNNWNSSCEYPRMWGEDGFPLPANITVNMDGCRASEFDQYGDLQGIGSFPSYRTQLCKFASVQDRLREWESGVLEKIKVMSCIQIAMLDIDGFRMDKGLQTTVDAMAEFTDYQRQCARRYGKQNFMVVGEVVGDPGLTAVYIGRGKQPDQEINNLTEAFMTSSSTNSSSYIRPFGHSALDGSAFHYDIYGAMSRFLGLDSPWGTDGVDWVQQWTEIVQRNDMVNANTGEYDPRHMFGMTSQDVFRWPALKNGAQRQLLGLNIVILMLPGIPILLWGEEQKHYIQENLSNDYVYGRQPMSSSFSFKNHGCYVVGETTYVDMPWNNSAGCYDNSVGLDHRDPSHPLRNILKRMYELRRQFPALNDGFRLDTLSFHIYDVYLRGSQGMPSPHGIWSVYRGRAEGVQDFTGIGQGNQGVWFLYQNEDKPVNYTFDCRSSSEALISAFPANTLVKNLFHPYEEYVLEESTSKYGIEDSSEFNGCLSHLSMDSWEFKALVPKTKWLPPSPTITRVIPGHDSRIQSNVMLGDQETVAIEIHFSSQMSCNSVINSLKITSITQDQQVAQLNTSSVVCMMAHADPPEYVGEVGTAWTFKAELNNVSNGIHAFTVRNATTEDGDLYTNALDRFFFRIGQGDNPMVFPLSASYTTSLLHKHSTSGDLYITPKAAGAEKFRYSLNWGSSYSDWLDYSGANTTITAQAWSGTESQNWRGEHVILNYWSSMTGSSDHVQHADLDWSSLPPRRWPHAFIQGSWNQYGYDQGLENEMSQTPDGLWNFNLNAEWPTDMIINVWGMNPDGLPDKSQAFGDVDGDNVLDLVPPNSLSTNVITVSTVPSIRYLGYRITVNDANYRYQIEPAGSVLIQAYISVILAVVPLLSGILGIWAFKKSFYHVRLNKIGISGRGGLVGLIAPRLPDYQNLRTAVVHIFNCSKSSFDAQHDTSTGPLAVDSGSPHRRSVLIATIEYEIEDWQIKVKIGGLGVMSSLMSKNLNHQNLVWVVPCIEDFVYPVDHAAEPMNVVILGSDYEVTVQYHTLRNITFVVLDAPIFRQQTKDEPYPARMDDLDSAIYYSAWNQCIAQAIQRFNVDLYHINDYHGSVAPLYLLPRVIPCCLSLHNAEFQGMWPLRSTTEMEETSRIFNLDQDIVKKYVQFGDVFNLLHAAASYLRIHQKGFGAVGVSKKYGKRSFARYPILWGLKEVGHLPNPDPSDTAEWDKALPKYKNIFIDGELEMNRGSLRCQAQEWAGLKQDPTAELFVFVGRWSNQKGVDLIADVFFSILKCYPNTQLICIGPVIDLYGKFAALKLKRMAALYPGRVCSKPQFTALPPCIFSGAEFALIPSRDEPFGLVAVEFGRKGALGVGSRVGGLGQMPGWWFTIESTTSRHLLQQFKTAIRTALASKKEVRAVMRARALLQRFPVVQWIEDLETLQSTSIQISVQRRQSSWLSISFRSANKHLSNPQTLSSTALTMTPRNRHSSPSAETPKPPLSEKFWLNKMLSLGRSSGSRKRLSKVRRPPASVQPLSNRGLNEGHEAIDNYSIEPNVVQDSDREHTISEHQSIFATPEHRTASPVHLYDDSLPGFLSSHPPFSPPISPDYSAVNSISNYYNLFPTPPRDSYAGPTGRGPLSVGSIVGSHKDFNLQKLDPLFTDSRVLYYNNFAKMLESVDAKSSEDQLCIEQYLVKSEKQWFSRFHRAKLGMSSPSTPASSVFRMPWGRNDSDSDHRDQESDEGSGNGEFLLDEDYAPPAGLKKLLQKKIGEWQIYCFLVAFGQVIAATSYQITLLTGQNGQAASELYTVASIYLAASLFWWLLFRTMKSVYLLSFPFLLYGLAIFILGIGPYVKAGGSRNWVNNIATGLYAFASASGSFYFALNFGTEGGTSADTWTFRACVIQGSQQIYIAALWYWGSILSTRSVAGFTTNSLVTSSPLVTAITTPVAVLLWIIALVLFLGLPDYYRHKPGEIPAFYLSLFRRKVVLWFFVMIIIQNYWLSTLYGRSWRYLWSSQHAPAWSIMVLLIFFFVGVWAVMLWIFGALSMKHSWILPIFAIGLGAPRWAQTLWGTSNIGLYVPWGSRVVGTLLGRSLWLWLGVLDALQGVGFGMILLQTLTRVHIAFTLIAAQVVGSIATIAARASAPNAEGPGDVFPDFSFGVSDGLRKGWFWAGLLCQLVICVGYFKFFRKEQLFKP